MMFCGKGDGESWVWVLLHGGQVVDENAAQFVNIVLSFPLRPAMALIQVELFGGPFIEFASDFHNPIANLEEV